MWRFVLFFILPMALSASIQVGIDRVFEEPYFSFLKGKRLGVITNQSAMNSKLETTFDVLKNHATEYTVVAAFAPEHGFYGSGYAFEEVVDQNLGEIPLYGLFGTRRRPTQEMLTQIDALVFDIQDIGSRSYTFVTTLFYCMEEAAKASIPVIVLDRPNPMGGVVVDGPLIEEKWRSFLGYIKIPYCHGMTLGELAYLFNEEYKIGCQLVVVPMKGWKRGVLFDDTGLSWIPTSPQIAESDTPFFYPATGLMGHCSIVNIGIGYTLPFKLVGAPWIDAEKLAAALNGQKLPGVYFQSYYYKPFFGKFKLEPCQGVYIIITNPKEFLPVTTQYVMLGILKNLYPKQFKDAFEILRANANKRDVFNKLNGSEEVLNTLLNEKYVIWKLRDLCAKAKEEFLPVRKKYLIPEYGADSN